MLKEIELKVENGELNRQDMDYIFDLIKKQRRTIDMIAALSDLKAPHTSDLRDILDTINMQANDIRRVK